MKRLEWKEELIALTIARTTAPPSDLDEIEQEWQVSNDVDYMTTSLRGEFKHDQEMYYYNTWDGRAGWNVITPLQLEDGRFVLLNRGFVPLELRDPQLRKEGQITGQVTIDGLARNPIKHKPNSLMPDNVPKSREFFWKDHSQMAGLIVNEKGEAASKVLPFMIDAGNNPDAFQYPMGGTTRMDFPNSHLQYALTWYGLAMALLVVGAVFLYSRRKA